MIDYNKVVEVLSKTATGDYPNSLLTTMSSLLTKKVLMLSWVN